MKEKKQPLYRVYIKKVRGNNGWRGHADLIEWQRGGSHNHPAEDDDERKRADLRRQAAQQQRLDTEWEVTWRDRRHGERQSDRAG